MLGLKKSKVTALALVLSFIFVGVQGDNTQASSVESDVTYRWPVPESKVIWKYYSDTNRGLDIISDKEDTEIVAVRAGKVTAAESTACTHENNYPNYCCNNGLGNYVRIEHEDGSYALYENLKYDTVTVENGDMVEEGQVIGIMGSSGRSSRTHLHFVLAYSSTETINVNPDVLSYKYPLEKVEKTVVTQESNTWKISNEEGVNLRNGAGLSYDKVGFLENETEINVLEQVEADGYTWAKINNNGQECWCALEYATKIVKQVTVVEKKENCLLRLETYGGEIAFKTYIYAKGEEFGIIPTPEKEGYIFDGWYTEPEFENKMNSKYTINEDTTLYAKWNQVAVEGQVE